MKKTKNTRRSSKRHFKKKSYRIRNWPEYNAALVQRGSLTIWLDEDASGNWYESQKSGKRGAARLYADSAIACALTLQVVFRLPLRATQGFLLSLLELMNLELTAPNYSTLSRRRKTLEIELSSSGPGGCKDTQSGGIHSVVDSTGFKVYGEGEWKVRQHGWSKRRTWRKLHVGINEATGEIVAAVGSGLGRAEDRSSNSYKLNLTPTIFQVFSSSVVFISTVPLPRAH